MSNLRLINETEITSGVTSVNITDVFSADFDIYSVTVETQSNSGSFDILTRFINSSGSVISASNYDYAQLFMPVDRAFAEIKATNDSHTNAMMGTTGVSPYGSGAEVWIFNPYSASSYSFIISQQVGYWSFPGTTDKAPRKGIAVLKQTASMTGFQIYNGQFANGTIRTYGLRVDS
jgi:hypothetical protein